MSTWLEVKEAMKDSQRAAEVAVNGMVFSGTATRRQLDDVINYIRVLEQKVMVLAVEVDRKEGGK